jgi:hypothetical protein
MNGTEIHAPKHLNKDYDPRQHDDPVPTECRSR